MNWSPFSAVLNKLTSRNEMKWNGIEWSFASFPLCNIRLILFQFHTSANFLFSAVVIIVVPKNENKYIYFSLSINAIPERKQHQQQIWKYKCMTNRNPPLNDGLKLPPLCVWVKLMKNGPFYLFGKWISDFYEFNSIFCAAQQQV